MAAHKAKCSISTISPKNRGPRTVWVVSPGNCPCGSLLRRLNLTSASRVRKAAPISLFWAPNGLNELLEVRFQFPFMLIGILAMAFSTGQSWHVLKSWYTSGGPEQGFRPCFADRLNQSLVSSVAQAKPVVPLKFSSYLI